MEADRISRAGLIQLQDIQQAANRIAGSIRHTPLLKATLGRDDAPLWVKAECLQIGGAFKLRGAMNALAALSDEERARGVITHSSGNHAQALARAARAFGVKATIVMPRQSPEIKRRATEAQGARIVLVDIAERAAETNRIREATGAIFVAPYDDATIIAGQGTIGLEILADLPELATVLVPVSGGGLLSGIAVAVKTLAPHVRVVGVEPELAGDLAEGFASGERVTWETSRTVQTIADGLRTSAVGELNWEHIVAYVDDVVTVSETAIRAALRTVMLEIKLVCEPSGAVAVAGYLEHAAAVAPGPAVAIVSGGNVEPALLREVLAD